MNSSHERNETNTQKKEISPIKFSMENFQRRKTHSKQLGAEYMAEKYEIFQIEERERKQMNKS